MKKKQHELDPDAMITEMAQGLAGLVRRVLYDGADIQTALNIIEEILDGLQEEWIKSGLNKKDAITLKEHLGSRIADEGLKADLIRNGVAGHA
ncbi:MULTISPECIES: hypothetical protein [Bartonella]|uniref:hypothetical protein n=1 Tax=Bartonella TaxID=773 RepID=UPI0018DC26ED|nr:MULTISPECIES: hypothetical protein [Bartonella]MBH9974480.1 hypothetical protein [Bartonella choladocola]MBI0014087.1 hypothetical protein [Bartonella sp. B10834G3]